MQLTHNIQHKFSLMEVSYSPSLGNSEITIKYLGGRGAEEWQQLLPSLSFWPRYGDLPLPVQHLRGLGSPAVPSTALPISYEMFKSRKWVMTFFKHF